jgi:hypothetical protein
LQTNLLFYCWRESGEERFKSHELLERVTPSNYNRARSTTSEVSAYISTIGTTLFPSINEFPSIPGQETLKATLRFARTLSKHEGSSRRCKTLAMSWDAPADMVNKTCFIK